MAARKAEPLVETLRVDAGEMREQLDELAPSRLRLADRPLHQLLADAAAAAIGGDAHVLDQAARGALRAQARHDAELQAADDFAVSVLGNHELEAFVAIDLFE